MIKKFFPLLLLLFPILVKAQSIPVGGPLSAPINLQSNKTYQNLTIDGGNAKVNLVTGSNVSNVHIHKLYLTNTKGFAILLNNCSNILIDSTFFNNIGFGVYAQSGSHQIQVLGCQFLNVNGIDKASLGHAVQYNQVTGGGNRINNNIIENVKNITDTSSHPHDQISLFQCNGIVGDSIQVNNNWVRGGQLVAWPTPGSTGDGIGLSDVGGNYQVARGNILVNPGYAGVQVIADGLGGGIGIKVEYNTIYSKQTPVSANGINIQNPIQMNMSNNRTNWTNFRGLNVLLADGETQYDYFKSPVPIGLNTNHWQDATVTPNVLPAVIITMVQAPTGSPNISYTSPNIFTVGTTIGALNVSNSGGVVTSTYTSSPALPQGLVLNATTGQITGTPTVASNAAVYVISASNTAGASHFNLTISVKTAPIAIPNFSYSPGTNVYVQNIAIAPKSPISIGGAIVSYAVTSPLAGLPTGLTLNTVTGVISGTPTVLLAPTVFTITGTNASGQGKATITLSVTTSPIAPPNINYPVATLSATYGTRFTPLTPTNSGSAAVYTVSPGLPFGFTIDPTSGIIAGIPGATHSASDFVVTATNTSGSSHATVNIAVSTAPLVITAISQTKYVNTPNPVLTLAYSGFLNSDTPANALTTQANVSTTASLNSPVGAYAITPTGAASNFYNISYSNGVLNVILPNSVIVFRFFGGILSQ